MKRKKTQSPSFLASFKLNHFFRKDGSKSAFLSWNSLKQLQLRTDFFPLCNSPSSLFVNRPNSVFLQGFSPVQVQEWLVEIQRGKQTPGSLCIIIVKYATDLDFVPRHWQKQHPQDFYQGPSALLNTNYGPKWGSEVVEQQQKILRHLKVWTVGKDREREVGLLSLKTCNPKNIEGGLSPEAINCIMMGIDLIAPRNFQWQKSHIIPQVLSLGSSALMAGNFLLNSSLILPAILPCPYY